MKLYIKNLTVSVSGKQILDNVDIEIRQGELVALMGPNGSGKSSLAQVLMGHPTYEIINQTSHNTTIKLDSHELIGLSADKRAKLGLFLAFQNPVSVPGVTVANLLKTAISENQKKTQNPALNVLKFNQDLYKTSKSMNINAELLRRGLNEDFSGGEKKKLEMLQAKVLNPRFAIFDEIDTGLDVDALKNVAQNISDLKKKGCGILLITHYQRILKYAKPDYVYILVAGRIKEKGDYRLAQIVEKKGYNQWLKKL